MTLLDPIPPSLDAALIDSSDRVRPELTGIESLADSILDGGLIQPVVIDSSCKLLAGGRRFAALQMLFARGELSPLLFHSATSDPQRPGFLVRGETSVLERLQLELKENLDRVDMPWRAELDLLVRSWRLAQAEAFDRDDEIYARDYGAMLGVGYAKMDAAVRIYEDVVKNPAVYKDCFSIVNAYSTYLKRTSTELAKLAGTRAISKPINLNSVSVPSALPAVPADRNKEREESVETPDPSTPVLHVEATSLSQIETLEIPLTSSFFNENGLDFMSRQNPGFCNHIVTDPDYAVDRDLIDAGPNNRPGEMSTGIVQRTRFDSLTDLARFFPLAFRAITDGGFLVMWYSLSCHNLIVGEDIFIPTPNGQELGPDKSGQIVTGIWEHVPGLAASAGFSVTSWPLIWNKMDYRGRSNAQPDRNFPKSTEFAVVCKKPGATLIQVQTSNVYSQPAQSVVKELGHPFAKPYEIWKWIYRAIAIKGQVVFDPFVGRGSSAIAAVMQGLKPIGCELQADHYHNLLINMQVKCKEILGNNIKFT